jgi:hypothetical protein
MRPTLKLLIALSYLGCLAGPAHAAEAELRRRERSCA